MKKIMFAIIILALIIIPVNASNLSSYSSNISKEERLINLFKDKINEIQGNEILSIENIKTVYDFDNNEYSVVELKPRGYLIFSNNSGLFTEYSTTASSPYIGLNENIFYAGPTYYYYKNGNILENTETNENINYQQYKDTLVAVCSNIDEKLYQKRNIDKLKYINDGSALNLSVCSTKSTDLTNIATTLSTTLSGSVSNTGFFYNLLNCGYYSAPNPNANGGQSGCCGFVALNMLIAYHDKEKNDGIMEDIYWADSSKTQLKDYQESLTYTLWIYRPKDGTTSVHIHYLSSDYISFMGITGINHTSLYATFFSDVTIINAINNNCPVILFCNLGPDNYHAIVAYEYTGSTLSETFYTCHKGYTSSYAGEYTNFSINPDALTIGSIYYFS